MPINVVNIVNCMLFPIYYMYVCMSVCIMYIYTDICMRVEFTYSNKINVVTLLQYISNKQFKCHTIPYRAICSQKSIMDVNIYLKWVKSLWQVNELKWKTPEDWWKQNSRIVLFVKHSNSHMPQIACQVANVDPQEHEWNLCKKRKDGINSIELNFFFFFVMNNVNNT